MSRHEELLCPDHFVELTVHRQEGLVMEVPLTLGRHSIVAYQNEGSAKIDVLPLGTSIIRRRFLLSSEAVRDVISAAEQ